MSNSIRIGLFGFGVVGEGIYKVLEQTPTLNANIIKIGIKNAKKQRNAPAHLFTSRAEDLLENEQINVIVELIDDADAAFEIVRTAMQNGKSVVSANKKMIAEHFAELIQLQKTHNVSFLYEASVGGSIPVIRNLEEYYDNDLLLSFSGIINGSTNYMLTKMNEEELDYSTALLQAQQLGFAESNPSLDVEGKDALNKLTIVLQHAYGLLTKPADILHLGITQLDSYDVTYANEKGYKIKLVATAKRVSEQQIVSYILPTFVPATNQLHHVRNEYNGVLIGSKLADEQFLYGKGAGRFPTASAVLSDISALRYDYRYEYKKAQGLSKYTLTSNYLLKVYVSYPDNKKINFADFASIEETYSSKQRNYLVGHIQLNTLQEADWLHYKNVSVIAF